MEGDEKQASSCQTNGLAYVNAPVRVPIILPYRLHCSVSLIRFPCCTHIGSHHHKSSQAQSSQSHPEELRRCPSQSASLFRFVCIKLSSLHCALHLHLHLHLPLPLPLPGLVASFLARPFSSFIFIIFFTPPRVPTDERQWVPLKERPPESIPDLGLNLGGLHFHLHLHLHVDAFFLCTHGTPAPYMWQYNFTLPSPSFPFPSLPFH